MTRSILRKFLPKAALRPVRPSLFKTSLLILLASLAGGTFGASDASAAPARIIILRHGEKQNLFALCGVGRKRAEALAAQYLGPTGEPNLLKGVKPAAIVAITLHTLETAQPIAAAWNMSIATNPLMLTPFHAAPLLNSRTSAAARDLLDNPRWHNQTVIMVWEHRHIADAQLERAFAGKQVTLRQLLNLDKMPNASSRVPRTWPDDTYDYFWILDYDDPARRVPSRFTMVRQLFSPPFASLPSNKWGFPEPRTARSGCL